MTKIKTNQEKKHDLLCLMYELLRKRNIIWVEIGPF